MFLSDLIGDDDDEEEDRLVLAERQGAPTDTDDAFFKNDPPMTRGQLIGLLREVLGPLGAVLGPRVEGVFSAKEQQQLYALLS